MRRAQVGCVEQQLAGARHRHEAYRRDATLAQHYLNPYCARLHVPVAVYQEAGRHAAHSELFREQAVGVVHDSKLRGVPAQEALGVRCS